MSEANHGEELVVCPLGLLSFFKAILVELDSLPQQLLLRHSATSGDARPQDSTLIKGEHDRPGKKPE